MINPFPLEVEVCMGKIVKMYGETALLQDFSNRWRQSCPKITNSEILIGNFMPNNFVEESKAI